MCGQQPEIAGCDLAKKGLSILHDIVCGMELEAWALPQGMEIV